jgi:hypothetical protein
VNSSVQLILRSDNRQLESLVIASCITPTDPVLANVSYPTIFAIGPG